MDSLNGTDHFTYFPPPTDHMLYSKQLVSYSVPVSSIVLVNVPRNCTLEHLLFGKLSDYYWNTGCLIITKYQGIYQNIKQMEVIFPCLYPILFRLHITRTEWRPIMKPDKNVFRKYIHT